MTGWSLVVSFGLADPGTVSFEDALPLLSSQMSHQESATANHPLLMETIGHEIDQSTDVK